MQTAGSLFFLYCDFPAFSLSSRCCWKNFHQREKIESFSFLRTLGKPIWSTVAQNAISGVHRLLISSSVVLPLVYRVPCFTSNSHKLYVSREIGICDFAREGISTNFEFFRAGGSSSTHQKGRNTLASVHALLGRCHHRRKLSPSQDQDFDQTVLSCKLIQGIWGSDISDTTQFCLHMLKHALLGWQ